MSETFNGGDLSAKPEQRPGEQAHGLAGSEIRVRALYHVQPDWPCSKCNHVFSEHRFLYGMGTSDRYRCEHKGCPCGEQYLITAMIVDPSEIDTEEKRTEFIKRNDHAKRIERERFTE